MQNFYSFDLTNVPPRVILNTQNVLHIEQKEVKYNKMSRIRCVYLRPLLKRRKLNISRLAALTGVPRSTLSRLANGMGRSVRFETLDRICVRLGCRPADLMCLDSDFFYTYGERVPKSREYLVMRPGRDKKT